MKVKLLPLIVCLILFCTAFAQESLLKNLDDLNFEGAKVTSLKFQEKEAIKVDKLDSSEIDGDKLVIVKNLNFKNGIVELNLIGKLADYAGNQARGFVGLAFRINDDATKYECIYLRPTNSRADDQLRRNHTVQYISVPDYPWFKLRKETPSVYESYVDFDKDTWTKIKIVVDGLKAKLYVNGNEQPNLIVNDLKLGETSGSVGLWIGPGTEAYFSDLKVLRED